MAKKKLNTYRLRYEFDREFTINTNSDQEDIDG